MPYIYYGEPALASAGHHPARHSQVPWGFANTDDVCLYGGGVFYKRAFLLRRPFRFQIRVSLF